MTKMVSPVQGTRVSSEYGIRAGKKHGGIDIATGNIGVPVRAAFAGVVSNVVSGRRRWQPATEGPVVAPGRTGDGCRVHNPDGEQQAYIHMSPVVTEGQHVEAGQLLGYVNLSGNTSGPHLHFETWTAAGLTKNPRFYFQHHNVNPGSTPVVPAPPTEPTPPVSGPSVDQTVLAYQRRQNQFGGAGLVEDGIRGSQTQAWEAWVREAQAALNKFKGVSGQVVVDGDYGQNFHTQVRVVQQRNRLAVDGILGNVTAGWMRRNGSHLRDRP